jgi:pimeloyl-ACP methyl ester carboxylesterase
VQLKAKANNIYFIFFVKITEKMKISFQKFGEKEQNIIFLHGWQQNSGSFLPLVPFFHSQFKLYLPDLPGFGKTSLPNRPFSSMDYAKAIAEWMNRINIKEAIVIGHSFGGKVASLLAYYYPKKIKKLILIAPSVIPEHHWWYRLTAKIPKKIKTTLGPALSKKISSRDYNNAGPLLPTFKKIIKENLKPILPNIKQPALIIWGKKDQELPVKNGQEIHKLLSNSKLKIVPGGHFPFWDNPKEISQIIKHFLKT